MSASDQASGNRVVRVLRRATGIPTADMFAVLEEPMPVCPPDGVVVRVLNAAVDPAMRGWLSAESNYATVPDGAVMAAHGVGTIIESTQPHWPVGQTVYGSFGWRRFAPATPADLLWPVDLTIAPAEAWLSVFGLNGLTAWIGFSHLAAPRPGETVLVSTAAGGVGSVVGQLARSQGVRAVGLTGSEDKVARAVAQFGYQHALNYRATGCDLTGAINALCPDGIDIFFDNTAGAIADSAFCCLKPGARIIQCGTASVATWLPVPSGPRREREMLVKRLSWRGFIAFDHQALFPEALRALKELYLSGHLRSHDQILDGLDSAPGAIQMLYRGANHGRLTIRP